MTPDEEIIQLAREVGGATVTTAWANSPRLTWLVLFGGLPIPPEWTDDRVRKKILEMLRDHAAKLKETTPA